VWHELLLLAAVPFLLYAASFSYGLVDPDDELYFRLNPAWQQGPWRGAAEVWKAPYLHDYFPVTQTTIWLDVALFGTEHFTGARVHALLWFIAGVWAVRAFVLALTGSRALGCTVALLYAVHPVCGHAVMWLSERKNLVALALSLWSVERYVSARQAPFAERRWTLWGLSWALFVLALLAKPHAVAIPVGLALYEVVLGRGPWRNRAGWLTPNPPRLRTHGCTVFLPQRHGAPR
jgi:hypothetical protein